MILMTNKYLIRDKNNPKLLSRIHLDLKILKMEIQPMGLAKGAADNVLINFYIYISPCI